jgi:uncharacterized protein
MAQESIQGRIVVIDLLRAVALFGIVLTHAEMGFHAGPPPGEGFMSFHRLDALVSTAVSLLVEGKFFIVFSFLFGLSFALQLDSATQRGNRFSPRFAWDSAFSSASACFTSCSSMATF